MPVPAVAATQQRRLPDHALAEQQWQDAYTPRLASWAAELIASASKSSDELPLQR